MDIFNKIVWQFSSGHTSSAEAENEKGVVIIYTIYKIGYTGR